MKRRVALSGLITSTIAAIVLLVFTASRAGMMVATSSSSPGVITFVNWTIPTETNANPVFTYPYTTTNGAANDMLVVQTWVSGQITADSNYSATYNSLPCSNTGSTQDNPNGQDTIILAFCPIGTGDGVSHNLVITMSFTLAIIQNAIGEYSGVAQTLYLDGGVGINGISPITTTMSTTSNGRWLVGVGQTRNGPITLGGAFSGHARGTDFGGITGNIQYADSNGAASSGSHSATWTQSGNMAALMFGLVPAAGGGGGGQFPPCATNYTFDWSQFAGCNSISTVYR